jgi:hypothetical protein
MTAGDLAVGLCVGVWRPKPSASRLGAAWPWRDFGDPWDFLLNAVGGREV